MRWLVGLALLGGCFYTEQINQRPSIAIRAEFEAIPHRGEIISFLAESEDPDKDKVDLSWSAVLCSADGCDQAAFDTGTGDKFAFMIPPVRLEVNPLRPVESIMIYLEGRDELGARARPSQELQVLVDNAPPELDVTSTSRYGYVTGTPVDVFAKTTDIDDGREFVDLTYTIFKPTEAATYTEELSDLDEDPAFPRHRTEQLRIVPTSGEGEWTVEVVATDRLGATETKTEMFVVGIDGDPCIAAYQPIAPLDGVQRLPLTEPTRFQIPVVADDLDPYPTVPNDPFYGPLEFVWQLDSGAGFQALATTSNGVELDPDAFAPDQPLALRVEIYDRKHTDLTCAAGDLQCSTTTTSCMQRLTWKLVVR